ncbi:MAG TPA: LPS assembly lipoprotein LptE [Methylophilaceae bacterium]|nr:LPS assembly lipoprotein LptE [Methylophilaceae bacterium]
MQILGTARLYGLLLSGLMLLSACGFQMRGLEDLTYDSLYVQGSISIAKDLKKSLVVNGVKIVTEPEDAQLLLDLLGESTEKRILSLSGTGVVREFDLIYRVTYRLKEQGAELWGEPKVIELRRDYSYSDREVLATGYEEVRLNTEMRQEATQQLLRSLVTYKVKKQPVS